MAGEILPSKNFYLIVDRGSAESSEHGRFELGALPDGSPIIRSSSTGKYWTLRWKEMFGMAIEAGIAKPEVPEGCGACGDACTGSGSCRVRDESPEASHGA